MFPHATADLAGRAGVTVLTIHRWKKRGLFAGIDISKTGGSAKGVRLQWPDAAMKRVDEILKLKQQGFDTDMIVKHFAELAKSAPKGAGDED